MSIIVDDNRSSALRSAVSDLILIFDDSNYYGIKHYNQSRKITNCKNENIKAAGLQGKTQNKMKLVVELLRIKVQSFRQFSILKVYKMSRISTKCVFVCFVCYFWFSFQWSSSTSLPYHACEPNFKYGLCISK